MATEKARSAPAGSLREKAVKKAVKKAPGKKSAKKAPGKKAPGKKSAKAPHLHGDHHEGRDLRRAYEHLGRMESLRELLPRTTLEEVARLVHLAETALAMGDDRSGADLLRAGEHLCFGALAPVRKGEVSDELRASANAECEHMLDRAEHHWNGNEEERAEEIAELYEQVRADAEEALNKAAYLRALEFARCADALAHVEFAGHVQLAEDGALDAKKKPKGKKG